MLQFNKTGYLTPNKNIISSIEEFYQTFVKGQSDKRKELFEAYMKYSDALKSIHSQMNLLQWINGSFTTTNTKDPHDIDLVSFIDYSIVDSIENELTNFKYPESINLYGVDAYIVKVYPIDHEKYALYEGDRLYWMDQFTHSRRNRKGNKYDKGFVELNYI